MILIKDLPVLIFPIFDLNILKNLIIDEEDKKNLYLDTKYYNILKINSLVCLPYKKLTIRCYLVKDIINDKVELTYCKFEIYYNLFINIIKEDYKDEKILEKYKEIAIVNILNPHIKNY